MNDALIGVVGAICGATAGWVLTESTRVLSARRQANQNLKTAAFVCLDRLLKVQSAASRSDHEQVDKEIYHLGGDMDKYRDRIAASPRMRSAHWSVYRRLTPILLEHDLTHLDHVILELEGVAGASE
jgi:hypothetical protein